MASGMSTNPSHGPAPGGLADLLRNDDSLLRQIFFGVLRHHHPNLAWCTSNSDSDFDLLEKYLSSLKPEETILVASSFSHMLNLHNLTEEVNASQTERAVRLGEVENPTRTTNRSLIRLTTVTGLKPEEVYQALCKQTVDLVLTAHPTQALRASLLKKYARVRQLLDNLHNMRLSNYEKIEAMESIKASVQAAWRTDEIRRQRPTPQAGDEMRGGMSYFNSVIFDTVPVFHRRIDTALANLGQPRLPLTHTLFKFGSWMGGDRDGNPNVTSETTRDVVIIARLEAVNAYFKAVENLMFDLSVWRCSPALKEYAERIAAAEERDVARVSEQRKKRNYADFWVPIPLTEPYRVIFSHMRDRLYTTREVGPLPSSSAGSSRGAPATTATGAGSSRGGSSSLEEEGVEGEGEEDEEGGEGEGEGEGDEERGGGVEGAAAGGAVKEEAEEAEYEAAEAADEDDEEEDEEVEEGELTA
ncbi:hypothetical protein QJQ45_015483 [Haematococcus lacustris]|nr:hypothetical protein QJQ45_015483 [Haematococcus lacustris]